tara:strand:+ start:433 stop:678 length:246 start_codon:yes stop_codon:yes gene_type:complete
MSKIIKHTDPFIGEIELREVATVAISHWESVKYYIIETEKFKSRGLANGIWEQIEDGEINHLTGDQVQAISRIYDKLTRMD